MWYCLLLLLLICICRWWTCCQQIVNNIVQIILSLLSVTALHLVFNLWDWWQFTLIRRHQPIFKVVSCRIGTNCHIISSLLILITLCNRGSIDYVNIFNCHIIILTSFTIKLSNSLSFRFLRLFFFALSCRRSCCVQLCSWHRLVV